MLALLRFVKHCVVVSRQIANHLDFESVQELIIHRIGGSTGIDVLARLLAALRK